MPDDPPVLVCACPSCSTRLRVGEDQLAVADGQVRCGACLAVFNARANLVAPQVPPTPTPSDGASAALDVPATPAIEPAQTPEAATVDDEPAVADPTPALGPRQMASRAAVRQDRPPRRERGGGRLDYRVPAASAAAVALILLLAVNVLGLQFSVWSQLPAMRGLYAQACRFAGCDLPPLGSLAHIRFEAQADDGRLGPPEPLTLAATLVNRAQFRQRFPTLAVRLLDAKGKAVARHRIAPAGYLHEDTPRSMAPNERTSIALRFDDPGAGAVRYAIALE